MPSVSSPARQKMASKPNKVKKGEKEPAKKVTKNKDKYDKEKRKELKKKRKHLQQEEDLKPEDHKPEQDDHGETEDAQQCKSKRSKLNDAASDPASPPHAKKSEGTATRITAEEARRYYEEHNIAVTIPDSGARKPYYPFTEFTMTNFDERILKACEGFTAPTPIQAACWPILTDGRDAVGIAETGSGKTFAFGLPALAHILGLPEKQRKTKPGRPLVLILAPTRELAMQTHEQCRDSGRHVGVKSVCLYGGVSKNDQKSQLKKDQPAILIATPGRLIDLIEDRTVDLSRVSYLVLDEADRMLDQGFEDAIRKIIGATKPAETRQTVMFSATWPESVRKLANDFLKDPAKVTIGSDELTVNQRVKQIVEVLEPTQKESRLLQLLEKYHHTRKNKVLVFVLYKKEAGRIEGFLRKKGWKCEAIHGDKPQDQRTKALELFKTGKVPLLIATDVAARGLDIPNVEYVINFTFPLTIDEYIHRIGRTGRAGKKGTSHTLFTSYDKSHSGELVNVLRSAGVPVPEALLKFGTAVKKKEHKAYGAFFKDIDPNVKGTKIIFD